MAGPRPVLHNGMGSPQGIWDTGATQSHRVGTRASLDDGRVFYYARNASIAIDPGKLLASELQTAQFTALGVNTAAVGDTTLSITTGSTAVTANEYADGYVFVIDDTGEGITYGIREHPAVSGTTAGVFTLKDPVDVAFTGTTTVQIAKNRWADLVISPTAQTSMVAGVSQTLVAAGSTTIQYFWCQTWGYSCMWQDEIVAANVAVTGGSSVAGASEAVDAVTEPGYGINLFTTVDTEYQPVFLKVAP